MYISTEFDRQTLRPLKVDIPKRLWRPVRVISNHSSWINAVAVTSEYVTIMKKRLTDDEFRYRICGISGSSGPSIVFFDCEVGDIIRVIDGHSSIVYSLSLAILPDAESLFGNVSLCASGSHDGDVKIWEVQVKAELYIYLHICTNNANLLTHLLLLFFASTPTLVWRSPI